jgi:hypothetical protein
MIFMSRFIYLIIFFILISTSVVLSTGIGKLDSMGIFGSQLHVVDFKPYGFRIGYPDEWKKVDGGSALFVCKMNCKESQVFCPNIVLNVVAKKEGALLSNYADFFLGKVQAEFKDMQLVSSKSSIINGYACTTIDYKMSTNGTHLGATTGVIDLGDFILFVNCMGDNEPAGNYARYRGTFEQVIKSVTKL